MTLKRLIATILLLTSLVSLMGCELVNIKFDHKDEQSPTGNETPEEKPEEVVYIYSLLSNSIHLPGCYHINEIKDKYKKEHVGDPSELLEDGYTLCKTCFPPEKPENPEDDENENKIPIELASYVINSSSKKIHDKNCYHIEEMSEANIEYTDLTLEELLASEHIPCASCLPEQWEQYKKDHPEDFPEK